MFELYEKYSTYYELCDEGRNSIREAARRLCADEAALAEAIRVKNELADTTSDSIPAWEWSRKCPQYAAVVCTVAIEDMEKLYAARGIDHQILIDTISDLAIWINRHHTWTGEWGLLFADWLIRHLRGKLFRLGRLQFEKSKVFGAEIYMNTKRNTVVLPVDGRADDDRFISSGIVYENGFAVQKNVALDKSEWHAVLRIDDPFLNVHIPAGESLSEEACLDSFARAKDFYKDYPYKAYGCFTWLFDTAFDEFLPRESNIRKFRELFLRFPHGGEDYAGLDYVFVNVNKDNIASAPRDTFLRRKIADHILSGGKLSSGGGYRLVI